MRGLITTALCSLLLIGLSTSAYAQNNKPLPETAKELGGSDTFLLRQLIEMQNDMKRLTREVVELRRTVEALKSTVGSGPQPAAAPSQAARPAAAPPAPEAVVDVELEGDDPVLGSADAQIAIVEFSDYECPFCSRFHQQTFPSIKSRYIDTGKLKYVLRDYPLGFHRHARAAAVAANCAAAQDAFWPAKEKLFNGQKTFGEPLFQGLATALSIDVDAYARCRTDAKLTQEVDADFQYGQSIGVTGTPTFFVGRIENDRVVSAQRIVGAQGIAAFEQAIDRLLSQR